MKLSLLYFKQLSKMNMPMYGCMTGVRFDSRLEDNP